MTAMEESARELYELPNPVKRTPRNYEEYWNRVKAVHEGDAEGSIGYRYKWSEDESLRLVLRTHTTAVSTWCLHRLAEDPRPARYFSIDRVFRSTSYQMIDYSKILLLTSYRRSRGRHPSSRVPPSRRCHRRFWSHTRWSHEISLRFLRQTRHHWPSFQASI